MVQERLLETIEGVDGAGVEPVEPIQGRAAEGGREKEAHAFISEAFAPKGRLEGVDVGERVLRASVESDAEGLDIFLLVVVEDAFGKGPWSGFCPEGLMAALFFAFQAPDLFEEKPHGRVGMRKSFRRQRPGGGADKDWGLFPIFQRPGVVIWPGL